jgi:transcriptional regulator with XRE-family HTH domain
MAKPNGPQLKKARERAKLSRAQLAERVGRSYMWIYKLETEIGTTKPESFYLLAEILNVPVEYVMRTSLDTLGESA